MYFRIRPNSQSFVFWRIAYVFFMFSYSPSVWLLYLSTGWWVYMKAKISHLVNTVKRLEGENNIIFIPSRRVCWLCNIVWNKFPKELYERSPPPMIWVPLFYRVLLKFSIWLPLREHVALNVMGGCMDGCNLFSFFFISKRIVVNTFTFKVYIPLQDFRFWTNRTLTPTVTIHKYCFIPRREMRSISPIESLSIYWILG